MEPPLGMPRLRTKATATINGKFWQQNYYKHVIRNETEYASIRNYILANPSNWPTDKYYKF